MSIDQQTDDPFGHAATVRRLLQAFVRHDRETIVQTLTPDCIWRVPGRNLLSGEYAGRQAVLDFLRTMRRMLTKPVSFEIIDITTSEDRAVAYQYGMTEVGCEPVRLKECLVYRFEGARIAEIDEFQFDQARFDAVFSLPVPAFALVPDSPRDLVIGVPA